MGDVERPHPTELHAHQVDVHGVYQIWNRYKSGARAVRHFGGRNPVRVHAGATVGNPQLARADFRSEIHFMVRNGIEQSRRFIYIEDQYFWHIEMARWLGERVRDGRIKELVIVTNMETGLAEHPPHTRLALQHLAHRAHGHTDRILVFERIGTHGRYVHSKMFIYDDVSAHVGSANFNQRGYSHDSESAGVWVDRVLGQTSWDMVGASLARKLRVKLWEKHLGVPTRHLFDALGAMKYWHALAEQTGAPTALVAGAAAPSVHPVVIDGQRWSQWARHQSEEPPWDVTVMHGDPFSVEPHDWIVDPA
ncbi:Phospholipase D p1 [Minicystis rosea]|nr:Phospholipase D p1 [Minicystis rosea]